MTAGIAHRVNRVDADRVRRVLSSLGPYRAAVWAIALAQALWLGLLAARGWYYQDDLTFLAQASGRTLGWGYLTDPVNEHLTPGLRLQFWLFRHLAPLNYDLTIVYRCLLQILCTVLLARLLVLLFGSRPVLLVLLACYAFSPLVVPGFMWFASATNLLPSQALAILAVHMHVKFVRSGSNRYAAASGAALFGLALFWEKTATIALIMPILTLCFLTTGSLSTRLRLLLGQWRGLVFEYLALAGFVVVFVLGGYGRSDVAGSPGAGKVLSLIADAWTHTFAPTLVGGPWHWYSVSTVYVSASDPTTTAIVIGQLGFIAIATLGIVRLGIRSLLAWLVPATSIASGVILVAAGRYRELGALLTRIYSYSYDVGFPLVLGVCLALLPTLDRVTSEPVAAAHAMRRPARAGMAVVAIALLVSGAVSSMRFVNRWAQSPADEYFRRLEASIRQLPPGASIYDTPASIRVLPFFNPVRNLSDVLPLAGLHPPYDGADQDPLLVTDSGAVVQSSFLPATKALPATDNGFCPNLIKAGNSLTLDLAHSPGTNNWFLRLEYFRQIFASVAITVIDADGSARVPVEGSDVRFPSGAGIVTLRLPKMNPAKIVLKPNSVDTNVCITSAAVGSPFEAHK